MQKNLTQSFKEWDWHSTGNSSYGPIICTIVQLSRDRSSILKRLITHFHEAKNLEDLSFNIINDKMIFN